MEKLKVCTPNHGVNQIRNETVDIAIKRLKFKIEGPTVSSRGVMLDHEKNIN